MHECDHCSLGRKMERFLIAASKRSVQSPKKENVGTSERTEGENSSIAQSPWSAQTRLTDRCAIETQTDLFMFLITTNAVLHGSGSIDVHRRSAGIKILLSNHLNKERSLSTPTASQREVHSVPAVSFLRVEFYVVFKIATPQNIHLSGVGKQTLSYQRPRPSLRCSQLPCF